MGRKRTTQPPTIRTRISLFRISLAVLVLLGVSDVTRPPAALAQPRQIRPVQVQRQQQQQQRVQVLRQAQRRRASPPPTTQIAIEPSAPIANLLSRAEDGIARQDWKFAIDSLQRIIEDPDQSLDVRPGELSSDAVQGVYESVRKVATRRLASLPPEALRAYRVLYDGRARGMLDRAMAEHDEELLRELVSRYLLTSYGDAAAETLASWLIDQGRPAEALAFLEEVRALVPDRDWAAVPAELKRATALAWLGDAETATAIIERLYEEYPSSQLPPVVIKAFLADVEKQASARDAATMAALEDAHWIGHGGLPSRRGAMPAIEPTLHRAAPWRFDFPAGLTRQTVGRWRPASTLEDSSSNLAAPTAQVAAADGKIFARTPAGVYALHARDLTPVWERDHPAHTYTASLTDFSPSDIGADPETDHVPWTVTVAGGVVLTIDRYVAVSASWVRNRNLFGNPFGVPDRPRSLARLTARDPDTGDILWQRGRPPIDMERFQAVDFRALPVEVNGNLWVPYQRQRDLYIAILDPTSGDLIDNILICSVPWSEAPFWHPLTLAVGDGHVYVPTGYGLMYAVSTDDREIKWAVRYGDFESGLSLPSSPRRLLSPPVVAGGVVIHAPVEDERLLALSTADGVPRWSATLDDGAYVVGAAQGKVVLAGRRLKAHSLFDGSTKWISHLEAAPTGRAAIAGDAIYVPTWGGLAVYDLASGKLREMRPLQSSDEALGNLLCLGDAMFVVDPGSIRRFPDVERAYPDALATYKAHPESEEAAIRLAWIELLREEPALALSRVSSFDDENLDDERTHKLARVRVETLLALAQRADTPADAIEPLQRALDAARAPHDRIRCGLLLSERLAAADRTGDAYMRLLRLGLTREAAEVSSGSGDVESAARFEIARRLAALEPELSDTERETVRAFVTERVTSAADQLCADDNDITPEIALHALADLNPIGTGGGAALLVLADYRVEQARLEDAEQLLLESMRRARDVESTAAAMVRLADLYLDPRLDAQQPATRYLKRLGDEFSAMTMPDSETQTVGQWVAQKENELDARAASERDRRWPDGAAPYLTGGYAWPPLITDGQSGRGIQTRNIFTRAEVDPQISLVRLGGREEELWDDSFATISTRDQLTLLALRDGDERWRTHLRPLGDFSVEEEGSAFRSQGDWGRSAGVDGHVGVVATDRGLFGLGLRSGRRIWQRAYPGSPPALTSNTRDQLIDVQDGRLATLIRPGRLAMLRVLDGMTLWERDLRGEPIQHLRILEDRVLAVDPAIQRAHLFDTESGELIARLLFKQHGAPERIVSIVAADGVLCGMSEEGDGGRIRAYSMRNGQEAWSKTFAKPVSQVFSLEENLIGVGLLGGELFLLEAQTGEEVFNRTIANVHDFVDGLAVDGTLILRHIGAHGEQLGLKAIDLATGNELWERNDLAPLELMNQPLTAVHGSLLIASTQAHGNQRRNAPVGVVMVNTRTGEDLGTWIEVLPSARSFETPIALEIHPYVLLVGVDRGVLPLELKPSSPSSAGEL